jgi:AraC-like DNA-binding protein
MQEQATLWRDSDLSGLEVMHANYLTHSFAPHRHESFVSSVIDRGVGTIWYRGAMHIAPSGSLVLLNPDEIHTGQVYGAEGWNYRALYPSVELLTHIACEVTEQSGNVYFCSTPIIYDPTLANLLQQLHVVLAEDGPVLERETWLLQTYAYLFTRHAERLQKVRSAGKEPRAVTMAREYLEAHLADNVSLTQLAQVTGLSPFYLVRVFHRAVGLPPHAYLNQMRLKRAKELLLLGLPIVSVAYEVGFTDQSHLTRRFKQIYGVTPGHIFLKGKNVQD